MEYTQTIGLGVGDLQHAALAEARRYMREAKGDRAVATKLVFARVADLGWITDDERDVLVKMHSMEADARPSKAGEQRTTVPPSTYFGVRKLYDGLLATGDASPVALALAAGAVGAYEAEPSDDGTTVVYAKNTRSYQGILGGAGAIIGGALGGSPGAAIGGAIGGVIGTIVDDCKD
ncbi:MAG TPA: hypothetical protein PLQ63_09510 [Propionicimonas sp.]|nr:hypothetical protein [Propionicimonas sp.]